MPMKANSERVLNKNLKLINNLPLFYYVLEKLTKCLLIDSIIINTDSQKIIEHLKMDFPDVKYNIRPKNLRGDFVEMNEIINFDIKNSQHEYFLQTHSTNPLLTLNTITKSIEVFFSKLNKYDSLFSVTRMKTRFYSKEGKPINHKYGELLRTQDLDPLFEENSNLYIFSKSSFLRSKNRIGKNPYHFVTNKYESIDIDDNEDFEFAKSLIESKIHDT
tara:strand:- start:767 stop:1420 length:654 start_codon:yes stop_codon:yes gene_type:complete